MNNTATNTATCPTVRKQIGKTTYIGSPISTVMGACRKGE